MLMDEETIDNNSSITTSTAVFDIKPVIVFNDGRDLQSKAKEA